MEPREFSLGTRQQLEWRWLVILALFLTGSGAGLFFLSLIPGYIPGMSLGVVLVVAGAFFLFGDLSRKKAVFYLLARPQSSWMSRGVIGISAFAILGLFYILLLANNTGWTTLGAPWTGGSAGMIVFGIIVAIAALFVGAYPGFLIGNMRPVSFWNGAYLPSLFLTSALLGGFGLLYLLPLNWQGLSWLHYLPEAGIGLIIFELLLLLGLVWLPQAGTTGESVGLLTRGPLRVQFYGGLLTLGLIVPLIIAGIVSIVTGMAYLMVIEGFLHLFGVFTLRYLILRAGVQGSPA